MKTAIQTRRCKRCRRIKPLDEFAFQNKTRLWRRWQCRDCRRAYYQVRSARSRQLIRDFCRAPARRRVDLATPIRAASGQRKHPLSRYYRLRHAAILAYGGYRCACCGEGEPDFLSLDHINSGGTRHRRHLARTGRSMFVWLRDNGYPPGFQVLCMNCNLGRYRNGGACPHQLTRHAPKG